MATPTPAFPARLATDADLKIGNNRIQTKLRVAIDAANTVLFVDSVAGFRGHMLCTIDKEIFAIESVVSTPNPQLIVAAGGRGFDGTSAAGHSAGARVAVLIDAWHHNALAAEIKAIESFMGPAGQNLQGIYGEVVSAGFDFPAQTPLVSLVPGNNSITLAPVPAGVNGTDAYHYLYIEGGTGAAESALITGGSAVAGASSGTLIIYCAFAHSGAYTIRSSTSGIQEAANSLPADGGIVRVPAGIFPIFQTLSIGNGSGLTIGTRNNITIRGCGKGPYTGDRAAATELRWYGPPGGTVVRFQGPIFTGGMSDLRVNGSKTAALVLDLYSTSIATFERLGLDDGGTNSIGLRMDAGASFNASCSMNSFRDISIEARESGAGCIQLGPTTLDFNSGTFRNHFHNVYMRYANDNAASYAIYLGWADNNCFWGCQMQEFNPPGEFGGPGTGVKHVRQPAGSNRYDFLPSENVFFHCNIKGITGDSGKGIGTVYWPYQIADSGGLPNPAGVPSAKNHRGWLTNGEFFDIASVSRFAFQNRLTILSRGGDAELDILGYLAGTGLPAVGTISTAGNFVTGDGTAFTPEMKGKYIFAMTEYRRITTVTSALAVEIVDPFSDNLIAGTKFSVSTGSSMFMHSDADGNIGTFDSTAIKLFTNAKWWATLTADGKFLNQGPIIGTGGDREFANAGGNVIAVADLIFGKIRRTAGGAQTDTTATAAQIVAAIQNAEVGMEFPLRIYNNSGGIHTLGLGAGVTIAPGFASVLSTANAQRHAFIFRLANVTPGAQAVIVYSDGQSTF